MNEMKNLIKDHSSLSMFFMKMMGSKVIEMEKQWTEILIEIREVAPQKSIEKE